MKAVVAAFNQEKVVGAFSVIAQLHRLIVYSTTLVTAAATPHPDVTPPTDHLPPAAGEIIALDT